MKISINPFGTTVDTSDYQEQRIRELIEEVNRLQNIIDNTQYEICKHCFNGIIQVDTNKCLNCPKRSNI